MKGSPQNIFCRLSSVYTLCFFFTESQLFDAVEPVY